MKSADERLLEQYIHLGAQIQLKSDHVILPNIETHAQFLVCKDSALSKRIE